MRQAKLFAAMMLAHSAFGFGALLFVRWGFQGWPQGAYTVIPGFVAAAYVVVLVWTGRLLGAKGQPFLLGVAAVFLGRIGGALAGAVLPGVGLDAALLYTASFGMLELRSGRLWLGTPALAAMMPPLLAYSIAYLWGRRAQAGASTRAREDAPHGGKGQ